MDLLFQNPAQLFQPGTTILFFLLFVWSIAFKGIALWHAAKNNERNWFIAVLILNTVGILEIVYLFIFSKKKLTPKSLLANFKK